MRNKINITEEESKRILSLHKKGVIKEHKMSSLNEELLMEKTYDITLKKRLGWNSGGLKPKYKVTKIKVRSFNKDMVEADVTFVDGRSIDVSFDCDKPDIMVIGGDGQMKGSEYRTDEKFKDIIKWYCAGKPKKTESAGGGSEVKPNTDGWGKLNKTNGTYTLRSNQPLKASVDFTTTFPKSIPAGTVVFHDYKKNDNKIIIGNTGVVAYCNRNTFIYNDGIDDLKNDGLMSTLKGIFCNGDKIKTWKELTYTPVDNTGETNTGGGSQTYPFDYQTVLNVFKQKFPEENIINPSGQGSEEIQQITVTDKMYAEA